MDTMRRTIFGDETRCVQHACSGCKVLQGRKQSGIGLGRGFLHLQQEVSSLHTFVCGWRDVQVQHLEKEIGVQAKEA